MLASCSLPVIVGILWLSARIIWNERREEGEFSLGPVFLSLSLSMRARPLDSGSDGRKRRGGEKSSCRLRPRFILSIYDVILNTQAGARFRHTLHASVWCCCWCRCFNNNTLVGPARVELRRKEISLKHPSLYVHSTHTRGELYTCLLSLLLLSGELFF